MPIAPTRKAARPIAPTTGSTFGPYSPTTCDGTQLQIRNQKDFSTEVRLLSNTDGPLTWQLGAYYLHIDRKTGVSLGADTGQGVINPMAAIAAAHAALFEGRMAETVV